MMLAPGAIAVLRYVSLDPADPQENNTHQAKARHFVDVSNTTPKSYKKNDISQPAFHVGIALPSTEESGS